MVSSQQQADYALSIWQSDRTIPQRERLRLIDEHSLDVIFEEKLRQVAYAMAEPPHRPVDPVNIAAWTGVWLFNIAVWGILAFEVFRP